MCCAVMHGVLSAMWYSVERFAEMSQGGCCIVMFAYRVLVRCYVVWCVMMCLSVICFDVLGCAVMHGVFVCDVVLCREVH